jgi:hypothetical protein
MKDQLASLAILKDMLEGSAPDIDDPRHAELATSVA